MAQSIRPVKTFVLRMWREPDAPEGDAYWRGLLRHLDDGAGEYFQGLSDLPVALRRLLTRQEPRHAHPDASSDPTSIKEESRP